MSFQTAKKRVCLQWALRIFLTVACVAMLAFIFSNSLKTGTQSLGQSSAMVDVVQNVASVVAPNSAIATATGEAYERLHAWVRMVAHFAEFALFGTLLIWCVVSYTWRKEGLYWAIFGVCVVPIVDEFLQCFVAERGAEFFDVCVDVAGGICGALFAIVVLMAIVCVQSRSKTRKTA